LSLDARERWQELEAKIETLQQGLSRRGGGIAEAAPAKARDLTELVKGFMRAHLRATPELSTRVGKLMSESVKCCSPLDSLNGAAQILWEANCGAVPVVDADGALVGVITDRDICMAAYTQGRPLSEMSVESAMSRNAHACAAEDSVGHALALMAVNQVRRLPVAHPDGRVAGVLSLADVARWVSSLDAGRGAAADALANALSRISQPPVKSSQI
jgi:CBS domain-containing protein